MIKVIGAVKVPQNYKDLFDKFYATFPLSKEWREVIGYRDADYSWALYNAQPQDNDVVLDIGCACSYFVNCLARFATQVYGIDLIEPARKWAMPWLETMERYEDYRLGKIDITVGNAAKLPYPDASLDKIYSFSALEHFFGIDDSLCCEEVGRVLKPGGLFIGTVDYNRSTEWPRGEEMNYRVYTYDSFVDRILKPSGLSLIGGDFEKGIRLETANTCTTALCFIFRKH